MTRREQGTAYGALWVLAVAFGWIEASVVAYLREIHAAELSLQGPSDLPGLQVTLLSLPGHLVSLEMAREVCTVVLLVAVSWLAGRRPADRAGAFLLSFGVWDLAYYGVLRLLVGWPDSLSAWDILFLIPLPWVAPVWAPITVAALLILAGSYLFWTSERERHYRWVDIGALAVSVLMTIAAFLFGSRTVMDHRVPERFPAWLFWAGVVLGTAWFLRVEGRAARQTGARKRWLGVRVRTTMPEQRTDTMQGAVTPAREVPGAHVRVDPDPVIREYTETRRRLDRLVEDARELGERLERLGHGLFGHPARMIVGPPDPFIEDQNEWDIVPSHPLPSIDRLVALTNDIRGMSARVEELRERLILMGRADIVEQPDGFFH
ncbi:MAG: hypothetical protein EHM55_05125 [Acidobacteria bacterium]|nr:MAG: hypothetical protein EHM55_05125 [Acidobacteriota bacterium]